MFLFFLIFWIVLNGRITLEIILFGLLISTAASFIAFRLLGLDLRRDRTLIRNFPKLLIYVCVLIKEIVLSSLAVMKLIFQSKKKPDPVIVEFDSGLPTDFQNVLLANSITLTPGTYTLFQEKDHFVVHCLLPEYAEGIENSPFIRLLSGICN